MTFLRRIFRPTPRRDKTEDILSIIAELKTMDYVSCPFCGVKNPPAWEGCPYCEEGLAAYHDEKPEE